MIKKNPSKSTDGTGLLLHAMGLKKANNGVTVGVQEDAHDYADGTSVLMVAMLGEFGDASNGLVPRHFLSRAVETDKDFYKKRIIGILKKYNKGETTLVNMMMIELGQQARLRVINHVEKNTIGMAENKASTAWQKGGNQPMVDTGHLLRQIDYKNEKASK